MSRFAGTLMALAIPAILVFQEFPGADGNMQPAWKAIWPLFGATNQLLAALALLTFVVFLKLGRVKYGFALVPALVMMLMPMIALALMAETYGFQSLIGGTAGGMFLLGIFLSYFSLRKLKA